MADSVMQVRCREIQTWDEIVALGESYLVVETQTTMGRTEVTRIRAIESSAAEEFKRYGGPWAAWRDKYMTDALEIYLHAHRKVEVSRSDAP